MTNHGLKLTEDEYREQIIALYNEDNSKRERDRSQEELDININHLLGCDFPLERREDLWKAAKKFRRWIIFRAAYAVIRAVCFDARPDHLTRGIVLAYGSVLTRAELESWFGSEIVDQVYRTIK